MTWDAHLRPYSPDPRTVQPCKTGHHTYRIAEFWIDGKQRCVRCGWKKRTRKKS